MASARSEDSIWFSTVFARQETPRNATAGLYVRSDGWYDGRNWNTDSASRLLADWAKQTNTFLLPASRLQEVSTPTLKPIKPNIIRHGPDRRESLPGVSPAAKLGDSWRL